MCSSSMTKARWGGVSVTNPEWVAVPREQRAIGLERAVFLRALQPKSDVIAWDSTDLDLGQDFGFGVALMHAFTPS